MEDKSQGKGTDIAVEKAPYRYGKSHAIWDYTVLPYTGSGNLPPLPQPKLLLDLATPEGCKAELT